MTPAEITLESHVTGDTWQGIYSIGPVLCGPDGDDPMPVAAASARMRLQKKGGGPAFILATTGTRDAPITLVNGPAWQFAIPPVAYSVWAPSPGTYTGHFEVTDTAGTVLTIYKITLHVLTDLTP